jgi:acyl-CoA thioester hydrolase
MGVVYHGNYAQYLELARLDWLSNLGISYKWMEENGVMLPVYNLSVTYKKSATFDDEIRIVTVLRQPPSVRIIFDYEIYNQKNDLLTVAFTELIFINKDSNRPMKCPSYILEKL